MTAETHRADKILLVGATMTSCRKVQTMLQGAGCAVTDAVGAVDAISRAQHGIFDMAILVSTGKAMDVAETVFNLRDARPYMPIFVIRGEISTAEADLVAGACPYVRSLTLEQLGFYLACAAHD
jgi:CheY-like chemotaxis protein